MADELAIAQYIELCERLTTPVTKLSKQQEYWRDRANDLAAKFNKIMCVVEVDKDNFQVWSKAIVDKIGCDFVYVTGVEV